ncbi:hypothetical protein N7510_000419 [Penicillium lagena]|uniref:uncharacterized protein n=1 Tax=Penicillium lagena TaxID=94218 RepID=UPI0025409B1D|nr:uncharacterized protein N7510_000419 [Penicillium lagena]KAJ5624110.1 hypothetical protein N7510_000419 [Penicillium lagena]
MIICGTSPGQPLAPRLTVPLRQGAKDTDLGTLGYISPHSIFRYSGVTALYRRPEKCQPKKALKDLASV